jgi:hypothetical protein
MLWYGMIGLTWANATHNSIRGPISIAWQLNSGKFTAQIDVPANTITDVQLPSHCQSARDIIMTPSLGNGITYGHNGIQHWTPLRPSMTGIASTIDTCMNDTEDDQSNGVVHYRIHGGGHFEFISRISYE